MKKGGLDSFFRNKKSADKTPKTIDVDKSDPKSEDIIEAEIVKPSKKVKSDSASKSNGAPKVMPPAKEVDKKLDYRGSSVKSIDLVDHYDPKKDAPFDKNQLCPFFFICQCFDMIADMKGANSVERKKRILINMFKTFEIMAPTEIAEFYLFATGRLEAEYLQEDLGVGTETMIKACSSATAADKKAIKEEITVKGDLGLVIEDRKSKTQTVDTFFTKAKCGKRLTFSYVFSEIKRLPKYSGQKDKEGILQALIFDCTGIEAKYVIRFLQGGNFKMGCAKATIQSGLARCYYEIYHTSSSKHKNSAEDWELALRKTSHQFPNYKLIVQGMQTCQGDLKVLYRTCQLTPGVPCKPMLAKPTKDINIIFTRFEGKPFTCEYKYDGLRGQIHYHNGKVTIYSRNLENMTAQYPDVCKHIQDAIKPDIENFIVDSEIVGMDHNTVSLPNTGKNLAVPNFDEQSQEKR